MLEAAGWPRAGTVLSDRFVGEELNLWMAVIESVRHLQIHASQSCPPKWKNAILFPYTTRVSTGSLGLLIVCAFGQKIV